MPNVKIDGQSLNYVDLGQGPAVLLGHSYLWSAAMWQPQIEALSRHYRVIAPDLWGHGTSGPLPSGTKDLGDLAEQMVRLLDHLELPRCHVIGLSVGGMWGAELALRHPTRVRSLVLMDTYLGSEPAVTRQRYFQLLDAIDAAGSITPEIRKIVVPIFFRPGSDPASALLSTFDESLAAFSAEQLRTSIVPLGRLIFGRADALDRLSALGAQRTLLISGEQDIPRPPEEMQRMAEIIGADTRLIPQAGHIANLENADAVTHELLTWLESQRD